MVKRYGDFTAVDDVSLRIPAGEFFGFLGPNGAGKTTTINAIVGIGAKKTSGAIRVFGHDNESYWRAARRLIGLAPQEYRLRPLPLHSRRADLSGRLTSGLHGPEVNERADMLLDRFGLASKSKQEYTKLSGGMKRRLTLARALIHQPKLLILDEPTAGVDVELRIELWDLLRELNGDGLTIFPHHALPGRSRSVVQRDWRSSAEGASSRRSRPPNCWPTALRCKMFFWNSRAMR